MSASSFEALLLERDGPVTTITLNRPDKLNAMNKQMESELERALQELQDEPACRAVVIRGAGDRAFSAGADMREQSFPHGYRAGEDWNPHRGAAASRAMLSFPKPLLASVHGYCLGGAAELILLADLRIAAESAVFAFPEASLNMASGWGGSQLLPRIVGRGWALDLLLTGRRISGREAAEIGLVREAVPDDALDTRTAELAQTLSKVPPLAARLMKRAVNAAAHLPIPDGMQLERDLVTYRFAAGYLAEGGQE